MIEIATAIIAGVLLIAILRRFYLWSRKRRDRTINNMAWMIAEGIRLRTEIDQRNSEAQGFALDPRVVIRKASSRAAPVEEFIAPFDPEPMRHYAEALAKARAEDGYPPLANGLRALPCDEPLPGTRDPD
jgi:hypothetical protein